MSTQNLIFPQLELKLDKQQINSLVQQYLQQCYRRESIKERAEALIQRKVDKEIKKMIDNGDLINRIARRIAKEIPLSEILPLIDNDKLNEIIQKRVGDHIINKL
jgi:DNA replicative helicase MCM subunit Mcm2 (Cdc46/Mcm family)